MDYNKARAHLGAVQSQRADFACGQVLTILANPDPLCALFIAIVFLTFGCNIWELLSQSVQLLHGQGAILLPLHGRRANWRRGVGEDFYVAINEEAVLV